MKNSYIHPKKSIVAKIVLIYFFLPFSTLYGQFDEDRFKQVPIKVDGEEIGGSNAIVQDHQGYIWLSTNLGLLKYDGYQAKQYKNIPGDSTSLFGDRIECLYVDHVGDVWVGSSAGLCKYNADCDCFVQYASTPGNHAPTGFISDMIEDQNKEMWFIQTGGLFRYEREQDRFTRFLDKPEDELTVKDDVLRVLLTDQYDNIWIGTGYGPPSAGTGLIRFNPSTGAAKRFLHDPSAPNSLLDNRVTALYEDQQGRILVGTYKCGLHIYRPESEDFERLTYDAKQPNQLHAPYLEKLVYGNDPFVQIIQQDRNGGYWVGTTGKGLNYFDPDMGKRSFYTGDPNNPDHLINNQVWKFIEDRQGILWLATLGGQITKIDPFARKFTLHPQFGAVQHIYESPFNPGTIWIGSKGQGLFKMDLETDETTNFVPDKNDDRSIAHNWVRSIYQENLYTLWLGLGTGGNAGIGGGDGGVDRLDLRSGTFTHFSIEKEDDRDDHSYTVFEITGNGEGYLWLGAGAGGLFRSNKAKTAFKPFAFQTPDSVLNDEIVFGGTIDAKGNFWTNNHSDSTLYKYNAKEGIFVPQLKGFWTTNMTEEEHGMKWIGTWRQGLLHYNTLDRTYEQYTEKDGLPGNNYISIVEDKNGIYWIGTGDGPAKLDTNNGTITSVGMSNETFNWRVTLSNDGRLFFPSEKGAVSFHPDHISGNPFPPEMVISKFLISGISYKPENPTSRNITLSNDLNDISIEYVGLHFNNSSRNQYQYKLTPSNDEWIHVGTERTARYPNLNPGTYHFQVKAANSDGVWSEEGASVTFTIYPPWWRTWWAYFLFTVAAIGSILSFVGYRSRALRIENQKLEEKVAQRTANLNQKTQELEQNSHELEQSLKNLKATQNQLVHSEKLASLGELTAGIAHEIQNPLNFVNNFSEVSDELIDEMNEEIKNALKPGAKPEHLEEVREISSDIKENLSKILHHGKRADSIVKGMLQHSKTSSGEKEDININALADEYLRLAYHGLRAKDKSFNATMNTDLDESIGKVSVIPQDMGRVLLNIITNGFYAINEKKHAGQNGYKPTLSVSTKKVNDAIVISVKDNGNGIPASIKEKIFQPFFTTKPTGEGTGLGLSLAYDIIQAHGGKLNVESEDGKWTEFTIQLPI